MREERTLRTSVRAETRTQGTHSDDPCAEGLANATRRDRPRSYSKGEAAPSTPSTRREYRCDRNITDGADRTATDRTHLYKER